MAGNRQMLRSTRDFLKVLQDQNQLWIVEDEVDPNLELACIQRWVCARKGPAILFSKVKGTPFPVATNLYGSEKRIQLAFGEEPVTFIQRVADLAQNIMPPSFSRLWQARDLGWKALRIGTRKRRYGPVIQHRIEPVDLQQLPQLKSWEKDGGAFITLPLVYTESPVTGRNNLGMYRVQLYNANQAGMHIQINRGGGFHYHEAESANQSLPVSIFVGGPPALTLAAIAPLPEDITELMFASLLMGGKLAYRDLPKSGTRILLDADFAICGHIPPFQRKPEGPFGDHYGYYSLRHDYPFVNVDSIYHRRDAVFPATIVGRPPQEDHYIAEYLQELLEPLFPLVLKNVKTVWAYEESGVHSLAAAIVKNRYYKEAFTAALRILGEGQLSLTKFLMITDQDCNIKDFRELFVRVLERADFASDLYVLSNISQDTLDYTGPKVNKGSKAILMGIGDKIRDLETEWKGDFKHASFSDARLFCPGVLCVKGDAYSLKPDLAESLVKEPAIKPFVLVVLVDHPQDACRSTSDFIWHVFTRFEPAADIYGEQRIERLHVGFQGPVVVDCRMKPWYPEPLIEDESLQSFVRERWGSRIENVCRKMDT